MAKNKVSPDFFNHPVFDSARFLIDTPAIKECMNIISQWVWTGQTGGLIHGSARLGKTTALKYVADNIRTRTKKKIPSLYVSIPERDKPSVRSIFRQLCFSANIKVSQADTADHLSDRFVHFIAEQCYEADCHTFLLLVDEMQRLIPSQLNAFAEVYDKLRDILNIQSTTVFMGNSPECWTLVDQTNKRELAHLRGRFFTQGHCFNGITSEKELAQCLAQYDKIKHPSDGPSLTQHFLPPRSNKSWKLASVSPLIWSVYKEFKASHKIESWPMQYFIETIKILLCDGLSLYGPKELDENMVRECIRASGLLPSLVRPVA